MKKNCPIARKTLSCFPLAPRRNDDVFEKGARSIARLNFHFHPLQQANSPSFLFYPHPRRTRVSTPTVISIFTAGRGAARFVEYDCVREVFSLYSSLFLHSSCLSIVFQYPRHTVDVQLLPINSIKCL